MSVLAHIGYGVEKKLITAIVASGSGMKLTKLIENEPGVLSVTHHPVSYTHLTLPTSDLV